MIEDSKGKARPVPVKELESVFKSRAAVRDTAITRTSRIFVAGGKKPPVVNTKVVARERSAEMGGGIDYEVLIEVDGVDAGRRARFPAMKGTRVKKGEALRDAANLLEGFHPDHLALSVKPVKQVKAFLRIHSPADLKRHEGRKEATTLFPPENRRVFQDTNYPWSTVGLVETNRGSASGVMIGPRHMLTCSHIIDWSAPAGFAADWVRFTPSYFDGDGPFGEAWGAHIYWRHQEDGDGFITGDEGLHDYAVVVLDQRIGDRTGWMGARGYDDDWDSLAVWSHMGYPGDINSGERPIFISDFTLDGSDDAAQELLHTADVFPGQSGGPMFAWWDGDVGPRAVAVQSWQTASNNGASGGMDLRDLVVQARSDFA